ncbi:Nuclear pore complex component [Madurella fahalii]|uniref:Nuclear pore complex component n=1 Tax=Madurella fahalii TaxID=1157608 RepID=A0ABQ0G9F0_9PEZI
MSSPAITAAQARMTPVKQIASPASPAQESPGNWKHPRLAEITRRQNRTAFSGKNVKTIVYNTAALAGIWIARTTVLPYVPFHIISPGLKQYTGWMTAALLLIPIINIILALSPLMLPKDDLADIPLTPAQRKLLGLPPSSRPATPNSVYSTPPRYSRTPSLAGSPASIKSYTSSPLSNIASPASGQYSSSKLGTSPSKFDTSRYSPSAASPLLHKAVGGGPRSSFGSSSAFGASTASSVFGDGPPTPTPGGKRSSVGLNSKWLYEKGRRNSSNSWLHQNLS